MKKAICFLVLLMGMMAMPLLAQDCKMCGDWTGNFTIQIPDPDPEGGMIDEQIKMYVRIKQYGDDVSVRVKTHPTKDPGEIKYWSDCNITDYDTGSISFTSSAGDTYDWDDTDRKNGRIISKASYYAICRLNYQNGKIVMYRHFRVDYYDRNDCWIDGRDYAYETISLYQEDDDW